MTLVPSVTTVGTVTPQTWLAFKAVFVEHAGNHINGRDSMLHESALGLAGYERRNGEVRMPWGARGGVVYSLLGLSRVALSDNRQSIVWCSRCAEGSSWVDGEGGRALCERGGGGASAGTEIQGIKI